MHGRTARRGQSLVHRAAKAEPGSPAVAERRGRRLTREHGRVGKSPWSGALALGQGHAVFVGRSGDNASHAHAAIQICVARSGSVVVRFEGKRRLAAPGIVVPAGVRHQLEKSDLDVVLIYLDPFGADAEAIMGSCSGSSPGRLGRSAVTAVRVVVGQERRGPLGPPILHALGIRARSVSVLDTRVATAMGWIDSHAGSGRIIAADLAAAVGLSPSRLAALFRQETGLAVRRFALWTRLQRAVAEIARGLPLTEAALSAGFSDGAHLTRTFRSMFGVAPSGSMTRLRILT